MNNISGSLIRFHELHVHFPGNMSLKPEGSKTKTSNQFTTQYATKIPCHTLRSKHMAPKVGYKTDWSIHFPVVFSSFPLNTSLVLFNYSLNSHFLLSPKAIHTILAQLCNQPAPYWYPGWELNIHIPFRRVDVEDELGPFGTSGGICVNSQEDMNNRRNYTKSASANLPKPESFFLDLHGPTFLLTFTVHEFLRKPFDKFREGSHISVFLYISFHHPYTNMLQHVDFILGLAQVPTHISFKSNICQMVIF